MSTTRKAAEDIRPGDYIYDFGAANKSERWVKVIAVSEPHPEGRVLIDTERWQTTKHRSERIQVKRVRQAE